MADESSSQIFDEAQLPKKPLMLLSFCGGYTGSAGTSRLTPTVLIVELAARTRRDPDERRPAGMGTRLPPA